MTTDARGWRGLFGVLAPSTNTIVQPDLEDMRVPGITAQHARILVPDMAVGDDASFRALTDAIAAEVDAAVDRVLTAGIHRLVMGMSAVSFYGGRAGAEAFAARLAARSGLPVHTGALASAAALRALGARRIAFVSPYFPQANGEVRRFFAESGFEVLADLCLQCPSPTAIAQVPEARCREALAALAGHRPDAIVQVGTNLSMLALAAAAERMLGLPVVAINAATWWHALRGHGVADRLFGQGRLLEER